MVASAVDLLSECIVDTFKPRQRLLIDQWADLYRNVVHKEAAEPGRWVTDTFAYMRRPMRLAVHPLVRQASFKTATQVGKTETLHTIMLYLMAGGWSGREAGSMMMMYPSEELAGEVATTRFHPNLMACEPVRERLSASAHDRKNFKIDIRDWVLRYVGSNSENSKIAYSVRVLCLDELDKFKPGWTVVWNRNKAFADYKRIVLSSPTLEGVGISKEFESGDRESFFVPCPHCGAYQRLRFGSHGRPGSLCWEGGSHATEDEAVKTAYYLCENKACGGRIYDWHKHAMNKAGVWVPDGQDIEACRERDAKAESDPYGCEPYPPTHVSFQISSLYSPLGGASFGEMAKAFIATRGRITQVFVNSWLGEEWKVAQDRTEAAELRRLCIAADAGGYRPGECQVGVLAITLAVDVQADRLVLEVRGWGERGEDTWLIEALELARVRGGNLTELDAWLFTSGAAKAWRTLSGGVIRLDSGVIDSGHFTDETYKAVRRLRSRGLRFFASKGQGLNKTPMQAPLKASVLDKWPDGTPMPGGVHFLLINSDFWKTRVLGQIKGRVDAGMEQSETASQRGSESGTSSGAVPGFYLPENREGALEDYLDQMTAEQRIKSFGTARKAGPEQYTWAMREGRTENHYWDCCCYNFALAEQRGVRRLTRNAIKTGAGRTTQDTERGPSTREMLNH